MTFSRLVINIVLWLALLLSAGLTPQGFSFDHVTPHFITPNGKNQTAFFWYNNPQWENVTGKVYDVQGKFIADMAPGIPGSPASYPQFTLTWNAQASNGQFVTTGVYVYVISAEDGVYRGLVVVIR